MSGIERRSLVPIRNRLLKNLSGRILELGSGTGVNVPLIAREKGKRLLTEPDAAMRSVMRSKYPGLILDGLPLIGCTAERLPVPSNSFDTVVATLVLCTVPDPMAACLEIRRVLVPGGKFLFIEHVRRNGRGGVWQDRLQPFWSLVGCGCHPNRETVKIMQSSGLTLREIDYFDPFAEASLLTRTVGKLVKPFVHGIALNDGPRT